MLVHQRKNFWDQFDVICVCVFINPESRAIIVLAFTLSLATALCPAYPLVLRSLLSVLAQLFTLMCIELFMFG